MYTTRKMVDVGFRHVVFTDSRYFSERFNIDHSKLIDDIIFFYKEMGYEEASKEFDLSFENSEEYFYEITFDGLKMLDDHGTFKEAKEFEDWDAFMVDYTSEHKDLVKNAKIVDDVISQGVGIDQIKDLTIFSISLIGENGQEPAQDAVNKLNDDIHFASYFKMLCGYTASKLRAVTAICRINCIYIYDGKVGYPHINDCGDRLLFDVSYPIERLEQAIEIVDAIIKNK